MSIIRSCRFISLAASFVLALFSLPHAALAQQVTYYDFDQPQSNPAETSYACSSTNNATFLFCFNGTPSQNPDGSYSANPVYLSDTYPAIIDPTLTDVPPVISTHEAVQMTPSVGGQGTSMWFAVPQKITSGFNAYFTFKFTPNPNSYATADGIAFVIQNAAGGGASGTCAETGAGPNVYGGSGGCLGYGGIDNSLAFEFDTYRNTWDPQDVFANTNPNNDNHVAIQNCGAGLPNSPDHTGNCLVQLNAATLALPAINSILGLTMADGNVHQVVITYAGPTEATPNQLQIFIDPPFNPGTLTPSPLAVPVLSGIYNIGANLNLINSAAGNNTPSLDSAYVGFTSATGAAFEQHEVMNWTFTPHTSVTQVQPIAQGGQPTVFPFGAHVYATTYPADIPTTNISQQVIANTITPQLFSQLVAGGPFAGSQCQVYDQTGGNCVVYSVSCLITGTTTFVQCPTTTPADPIGIKSNYTDTLPAVSPGYIQGDPFYNLVTSITSSSGTATVTCAGECAVTTGQSITLAGSTTNGSPSAFNGPITVGFADPNVPNVFTYSTTIAGTATGGYLTSNNVENVFFSYSPLRIDPTTTGKVNHFSDFVVTALTVSPVTLNIQVPSGVTYGQAAQVIVSASSGQPNQPGNGSPTGNVLLTVDSNPAITQPLIAGAAGSNASSAAFNVTGLSAGTHTLSVSYPANGSFGANTASGSLVIGQAQPVVSVGIGPFPPGSAVFAYEAAAIATASISSDTYAQGTIVGTGACSFGPTSIYVGSPGVQVRLNSVGNCTVTANWPADANNLAASGTITVNVPRNLGAPFQIVATPLTTSVGSPVSVSASFLVNGGPDPSFAPNGGTITVSTNVPGDPTCTFAAPSGSCSLTFATPGQRFLSGAYSGDVDFLPNTSITSPPVTVTGPIASLSASTLNFGTLYLGSAGLQSVTLTNIGSAPMTVNEPFLFDVGNGDSKEFIALSLCPRSLGVGKSCSIYIAFIAGPGYNTQTATLQVMDNAPGNPQLVSLTANVINPVASFSPRSVSFGTVGKGTASQPAPVVITNSGGTTLNLTSISLRGNNVGDFSQTNNCSASLAPGASCTVMVTFKPTASGSRSASVYVVDNMQNGSQQVSLSGTGK